MSPNQEAPHRWNENKPGFAGPCDLESDWGLRKRTVSPGTTCRLWGHGKLPLCSPVTRGRCPGQGSSPRKSCRNLTANRLAHSQLCRCGGHGATDRPPPCGVQGNRHQVSRGSATVPAREHSPRVILTQRTSSMTWPHTGAPLPRGGWEMGMSQVVLAPPLTGGQSRPTSLQRRCGGVLSWMPSQCPQLLPTFLRRSEHTAALTPERDRFPKS